MTEEHIPSLAVPSETMMYINTSAYVACYVFLVPEDHRLALKLRDHVLQAGNINEEGWNLACELLAQSGTRRMAAAFRSAKIGNGPDGKEQCERAD